MEELDTLRYFITETEGSLGETPGFAHSLALFFQSTAEQPGLAQILEAGRMRFVEFRDGVTAVFGDWRDRIIASLVSPLVLALNTVIDGINLFIQGVNNTIRDFTSANLGPFQINVIELFGGTVPSFELLDHIPIPSVTRGQRGGLFGSGLIQVGEAGPEFLLPSTQFAVFPNEVRNALLDVSRIINNAQAQHVFSPATASNGGAGHTYYDYSMTNQFEAPRDSSDLIDRLRIEQIPSNFR